MKPPPAHRYRFLLLFGPECAPAEPGNGRSALPEIVVRLAETGDGHWWMETESELKRCELWLAVSEDGRRSAFLFDRGSELDLRTHHARLQQAELYAYLLDGEPEDVSGGLVSGRGGGFHVSIRPTAAARVFSLQRESFAVGFVCRYPLRAELPKDVTHATFLPGVVWAEADDNELIALLDPFGPYGDDEERSDYAFTIPISVPDDDTAGAKAALDWMLARFSQRHPDRTGWPPLLRLVAAFRQPMTDTIIRDGASASLHPIDPDIGIPEIHANWKRPLPGYARRVLVEDKISQDWKGKLLEHQREELRRGLEKGGWDRLNFGDKPTDSASSATQFECRTKGSPPNADADLGKWSQWLGEIPVSQRRHGWSLLVDLVRQLANAGLQNSSKWLSVRLTDCVSSAGFGCGWRLEHDKLLDRIANELFPEVSSAVQGRPFSDRPVFLQAVHHFLFAVLLCQDDDWLAYGGPAWCSLTQALGEQPGHVDRIGRTLARMPVANMPAVIIRLLLPRARLVPRGFVLNQSQFLHPATLLGDGK